MPDDKTDQPVKTDPPTPDSPAPAPKAETPPPTASRFEPRRPRPRDWLLTLVPLAVMFGLMSVRGDVVNPRGEDPARPLGHFAALWHSGHVPGAILIGFAMLVLATIGVFGLL